MGLGRIELRIQHEKSYLATPPKSSIVVTKTGPACSGTVESPTKTEPLLRQQATNYPMDSTTCSRSRRCSPLPPVMRCGVTMAIWPQMDE